MSKRTPKKRSRTAGTSRRKGLSSHRSRKISPKKHSPKTRELQRWLLRVSLIYLGFNLSLNMILALTSPIQFSRILEFGHLDSRSIAALLLSRHLVWHSSWEAEQSIAARIQWAAEEAKIRPELFRALVETESGLRPHAVSPVGACGLTQLMPQTARMLGVHDPFDPDQNLSGGARYLKMLLERFQGDTKLALAAYNAGPSRVAKLGAVPEIAETKHYVEKIITRLNELAPPSKAVKTSENPRKP